MMEKQKGKYVFECDSCCAILNTNERDFQTALDAFRVEGWISKKDASDQWQHFCPNCG